MEFDFYSFYEALNASGAKIRLDAGDPDLPPPKALLEVLMRELPSSLGYTSASGMLELRERIAELHGVDINEVIVTPGSKAALSALVHSANTVGLFAPYWPGYRVAIDLFQKRLVVRHLSMEQSWLPDTDTIISLAGEIDTLLLNYPNNPTGAVLDMRTAREVLEAARDSGVVVVSDEAYRDIVFDGPRIVMASLETEGVVSIYSFSKTFSIPGLRVGYAVGDPALVKRIRDFISATYTGVPRYSQLVALKALEIIDEVSREVRRVYHHRLSIALKAIDPNTFDYSLPKGGIYLFLRLRNGIDGTLLAYRLARKGIGVFPGVAFGGSRYRDYIRVSLTAPAKTIVEGLKAVAEEARIMSGDGDAPGNRVGRSR